MTNHRTIAEQDSTISGSSPGLPLGTAQAASTSPEKSLGFLGQGRIEAEGFGDLWIVWSEVGICEVHWSNDDPPLVDGHGPPILEVPDAFAGPLRGYFAGDPVDPAALPVDLRGTPFQRRVWQALRTIPRGQVRSYGGLAADIDSPRATRAVGMANSRNPAPIVVPCHRVVATGYRLGGFSGGLPRKRFLLALEGVEVHGDRVYPGQLELS